MAQPVPKTSGIVAPLSGEAIDRAHLSRMTFGDTGLERELLALFDRQAALLLSRMRTAEPTAVAALAHTLKGSAVGVGAQRVAQAALAVEGVRDGGALRTAIEQLATEIEAVRAEIGSILHAEDAASPARQG